MSKQAPKPVRIPIHIPADSTTPLDWNNELSTWLEGRDLKVVGIKLEETQSPSDPTPRRWIVDALQ
jgi:hypothetical protein